MGNVLDQPITLALNNAWQAIGVRSVREAILAMNAGRGEEDRAAVGLDISYRQNSDGSYDFSEVLGMTPVAWDEWVQLPLRPFDSVIRSAKLELRAPTVVIARNFGKMPQKAFRPSKKTIFARDKGICQYTGQQLSYARATLDHVIPRSRGGKDTFENLVLSAPDVNHAKGNKSNKEAGLKLLKNPTAPLPMPASALITEARHIDWSWFLVSKKH